MTIKEKIQLLEKLISHYKELNSNFDSIYKLFGSADSKFCNSVWNPIDSYTDLVSKVIEDQGEWVTWYIHENGCGANGFTATIGKKKFKVDSVSKLVKLIEWHNKSNLVELVK